MKKTINNTTILTIGDHVDYDSYKKFDEENNFIKKEGFNYETVNYEALFKGDFPNIESKRVFVFTFFPFKYWDKNIEHSEYRGIYGNRHFYQKYNRFCKKLHDLLNEKLWDKEVSFINDPIKTALYRDKLIVKDILAEAGVSVPGTYRTTRVREISALLEKGHKFFIKPRCGSMGKGITFLSREEWQTNFRFKDNKILSKKSDNGWSFHKITDNKDFLRQLINKYVLIEEAIEPLNMKKNKVDFRVYALFGKILFIYPRKNSSDSVTTNISQGGKGSPALLKYIPNALLGKIKRESLKALKALNLDFAGIDVMVDSSGKNAYILDVNMFPGFPKKRTLNLSRIMVKELKNGKIKKKTS